MTVLMSFTGVIITLAIGFGLGVIATSYIIHRLTRKSK